MTVTVAIDTSGDVCVGVAANGRTASSVLPDRRAHAEQLIPLLQQACTDVGVELDQVESVIVGIGPGPFTGLRVGVAAAAVLAEAAGAAIRGVGSLDVIARQWIDGGAPDQFVVVSDARRREVYWATYNNEGERLDGPNVSPADQVPDLPAGGTGAELLGVEPSGPVALDPESLACFGEELENLGLEPLYLRRPDADVPTKRKSTLVRRRR